MVLHATASCPMISMICSLHDHARFQTKPLPLNRNQRAAALTFGIITDRSEPTRRHLKEPTADRVDKALQNRSRPVHRTVGGRWLSGVRVCRGDGEGPGSRNTQGKAKLELACRLGIASVKLARLDLKHLHPREATRARGLKVPSQQTTPTAPPPTPLCACLCMLARTCVFNCAFDRLYASAKHENACVNLGQTLSLGANPEAERRGGSTLDFSRGIKHHFACTRTSLTCSIYLPWNGSSLERFSTTSPRKLSFLIVWREREQNWD